jgi:cystathionine beta-lyase/cystathionine gamma-synthase
MTSNGPCGAKSLLFFKFRFIIPTVSKYKDETLVTHQPGETLIPGNRAVVPPVYHSVKYTCDTLEMAGKIWTQHEGRYAYSRVSNPTVRQLELLLAELQGREDAIAVGSGVAALSVCFLALLRPEDHVLLFLESYQPTRYLIQNLMGRFGIRSSLVSIHDRTTWEKKIEPGKTKLIVFESPTNPMTRIADLTALTSAAKKCGALTLMDNTFAGFHNHGQFPIDIFIHSLTKFGNGHGDAMGGVIIADRNILQKLRMDALELGPVLDPHAAYLVLRGMKTYFLRYERSCENAMKVAQFLENHPAVTSVLYPGLASHPEYALGKRQTKDFGAVIALDLKDGEQAVERFINKLQLFILAGSLGSTESLVNIVKRAYASDFTVEQLKAVGISDATVRLSVGIEAASDLISDLEHALA